MAESSTNDDSVNTGGATTARETDNKTKKNLFRRSFSILGHLFHRTSKEDFERKLQNLSKEEATVHTGMKRRAQVWRKLARGIIVYSVIIELLLLGVAVIATRAPELSWQERAIRVLPVFAFPALSTLLYTTFAKYYRMRERKDQKTLDRLRNERQAKIEELKERTNYYLTQQLIQKYDSDMTAKEAAARVLASKLGADAGLKLAMDPSQPDMFLDQDATAENVHPTGLRKRSVQKNSIKGMGSSASNPPLEDTTNMQGRKPDPWQQRTMTDQFTGKVAGNGWISRVAAMLVGEDPTQSYALICANCHMHNGLARKEEFQFIAYYCPHCHFLNGPQQPPEGTGNTSGLTREGDLPVLKKESSYSEEEMSSATVVDDPAPKDSKSE